MTGKAFRLGFIAIIVLAVATPLQAQVCNLRLTTDANPDYTDMQGMIHSIAAKWPTDKEKCWALFYWNHIARRQCAPMKLHGVEVTDPIMQFNDYGYAQCSTMAGMECGIWHNMGYKVKYWDITAHTVAEVFYDDAWHMYDASFSGIYTRCDGTTIASVAEIGATGACPASGGKNEPGHIARYHCLTATSKNGWLAGADGYNRTLMSQSNCFAPDGLKYRDTFNNWDWGHRYILNLREGETYTRHYRRKGNTPEYYVSNWGADPDKIGNIFRNIRSNGEWTFKPDLSPAAYRRFISSESGITATADGLTPARADAPGEVVFRINSANITTGMTIKAGVLRKSEADGASIAVSVDNGRSWAPVWTADKTGEMPVEVKLVAPVNGSYETLVKFTLTGKAAPADAALKSLEFDTITQINSKNLPRLLLGRNTVYIGAGDQSESIVIWPDLQKDRYKCYAVEEKNIKTLAVHQGWNGVMFADKGGEEAYVVFKVDAPRDITGITYGGRFYNRTSGAKTQLLHSFDGGRTWDTDWTLTDVKTPWNTIHYVTLDKVPEGVKSVLFKYSLNARNAGNMACSIYGVRMEVNHKPADPGFKPLEVTFTWSEVQPDRTRVERHHTQLVPSLPFKYVINTGGADHPGMKSLSTNVKGAAGALQYGYSDGKDVGGEKFLYRWVTYGKNFLEGKPYTLSIEPEKQYGDDPDRRKLTDGVVGPNYAGGDCPSHGAAYTNKTPEIVVDMGEPQELGAFCIQITAGWPWWDALRGEVKDEVEVFTSLDGATYASQGKFDMSLRYKDIPINHMLADEETARGWNFLLIPPKKVKARYVKYVVAARRRLSVTEVQALDFVKYEPFDMRVALPDEK